MGRMIITILGHGGRHGDRRRAGIEAAKAEGVYKGRKKGVDDDEIRRRVAAGASKAELARELKGFQATIYRALADQGTPSDSD